MAVLRLGPPICTESLSGKYLHYYTGANKGRLPGQIRIVVRPGESVLADAVFAIRALLPTLQLLRLDLPQVANIAEHSDLGVIVDISVTKQCVADGIA